MNENAIGATARRRIAAAAVMAATTALISATIGAQGALATPAAIPAGLSAPSPGASAPPSPCPLPGPSAIKVRILSPDDDSVIDLATTPSLDVRGLIKGKGSSGVTGVEIFVDDVDLGTAPVVATTAPGRAKGADGLWGRGIALPAGNHLLLACARTAAGPVALDSLRVVTAAVTTTSLPDAVTGRPYSVQLTATVPHPAWQVAGSRPAGLTLSKTGLLSGIPTTPGMTSLALKVINRKNPLMTASATLWLKVAAPGPLSGTICAWGSGASGELGDGKAFGASTVAGTPGPVAGLSGVTAVAATIHTGFGLRTDGTVWGWGSPGNGVLGTGVGADTSTPGQIAGLSGVTAVAGSFNTGYALKGDGTVWAWGQGGYANLGNGTYDQSSATPVRVSGLTGVTAIAGAGYTAFAVKSDGTVWGWGQGSEGQLGDQPGSAGSYSTSTPVQIPGLSSITAVAGNVNDGYALKSDGSVWAWGWEGAGALGNGTTAAVAHPTPVKVGPLSGVSAISAGTRNGYALRSDGTVWAWGGGASGGLGNGATADSGSPVRVSALGSVTAIGPSVGATQFAVTSQGTVWAWGLGDYAALGNGTGIGTYNYLSTTPVQVSGPSKAIAAAGALQTGLALVVPGSNPAADCAG